MRHTEQKPSIVAQTNQHAGSVADGTIPFSQRLTCTIDEACNAMGLGRTKLYELIGAGCLDTTTIGRRRLISVHSLRALLEPKRA
jgi:excisionase family DNA binding protein